ncbi:MAG: SUF system Fe-S cluster assembly protein [Calditrichaceae bacterium]|jgi:FeS assembly SUF system protein
MVDEGKIIGVLKTVYDPEIPVNIYDLGLVYTINIDEQNHVKIGMTLTSPNCPEAESLPVEVKDKVSAIEGVESADVEILWEPPWNPDMMSEVAKLELGYL